MPRTRSRAAALVALVALAACDAPSPTAASGAAESQRAGFATPGLAAPRANSSLPGVTNLSVTDSNGTPLISWAAASGATSYTVSLITFHTINGQYQSHWLTPVTTTTSTSYLDVGQVYTGVYECNYEPDWGGDAGGVWYEYSVQANYPQGSSSYLYSRHYASIAQC